MVEVNPSWTPNSTVSQAFSGLLTGPNLLKKEPPVRSKMNLGRAGGLV